MPRFNDDGWMNWKLMEGCWRVLPSQSVLIQFALSKCDNSSLSFQCQSESLIKTSTIQKLIENYCRVTNLYVTWLARIKQKYISRNEASNKNDTHQKLTWIIQKHFKIYMPTKKKLKLLMITTYSQWDFSQKI